MLCHLAFGYILEGLWDPRSLLSVGEYLIIMVSLAIYSDFFARLVGWCICCFLFVYLFVCLLACLFVCLFVCVFWFDWKTFINKNM